VFFILLFFSRPYIKLVLIRLNFEHWNGFHCLGRCVRSDGSGVGVCETRNKNNSHPPILFAKNNEAAATVVIFFKWEDSSVKVIPAAAIRWQAKKSAIALGYPISPAASSLSTCVHFFE
jgi:hypothetical protein